MSDFNPYSQNPLPESLPPTESSVRLRLLPPAIGILLFSTLHVVVGLLIVVAMVITETSSRVPMARDFLISLVICSVSVIYAFALVIGSIGMMWRGSYAWVLTTCVLALVPFIGPCYVVAIPFGIWGLIILTRPNTREALESRRNQITPPMS